MRPLPFQFSLNLAPAKSSQKRVLRTSTPVTRPLEWPAPSDGIGYSEFWPLPYVYARFWLKALTSMKPCSASETPGAVPVAKAGFAGTVATTFSTLLTFSSVLGLRLRGLGRGRGLRG